MRSCSRIESVLIGDSRVPAAGFLQSAGPGWEVDVGKAEALFEAFGPLEIVEQGPRVVGAHVGAVGNRSRERLEVAAVEIDAPLVANAAVP